MMRLKKGDKVEVFCDYSWRTGTISKAWEGKRGNKTKKNFDVESLNQYLVTLQGCSQEFIVHEPNVRMKETCCDDRLILHGMSSRGEDAIGSKPMVKNRIQKNSLNILDETLLPESRDRSKLMKRMPTSFSEEHNECTRKLRAIEKDGRKQRLVVGPFLEKVDAVAYPRETLGRKNMHTSVKFISTGCKQIEGAKIIRNTRLNRSDSDACSIGSCSVTDQHPNNLEIPSVTLLYQETDTASSDAESCSDSVSEIKYSSLEEVEVSIHRLELHAYRRTLEALYASGPLSWEQESMLTNLRIMLHISNDEHLIELKNLISAKSALSFR